MWQTKVSSTEYSGVTPKTGGAHGERQGGMVFAKATGLLGGTSAEKVKWFVEKGRER